MQKKRKNNIMAHTGECLCGLVSYVVHGDFIRTRSCHCSRCRKAFGASGSAVAFIEYDSFSWKNGQDNLTLYQPKPDLGVLFCKSCGSKICFEFKGRVAGITLGSLKEDPQIKLDEHIFTGSKASWDDIGGNVPQFDEHPPE